MKRSRTIFARATGLLLCVLISGISALAQHSGQHGNTQKQGKSKTPQQKSAQQKMKLTDPEIASVAVVANQIDIDHARLAQEKTQNTEVLNFAQTMITDHQAVIDQATALVKKLNVTPKENDLSRKLQTDSENSMKMLRAKSGSGFDQAYIDHEVMYHQAVISTVENNLIPNAKNAELKALLQNILPSLRAHLEHAQMLKTQYAKE
jgi:putative membrane protein